MRCLALFFGMLVSAAIGARAEDLPATVKPSVVFADQTLTLAFEADNPHEQLKEFIPPGETLDHWTHLASMRTYPSLNDPKAVVDNVVKALAKQNPLARHKILENPKTGEVMVDFVTWPEDSTFVEFNVFRYSKLPGGGLLVQQYALRSYGAASQDFLRGLKPVRERLVDLMATKGLVPADKDRLADKKPSAGEE